MTVRWDLPEADVRTPITFTLCLIAGGAAALHAQGGGVAEPDIADNSFFIEEAYNQEPGVVQHLVTLLAAGPAGKDLFLSITQEWPFRSQRHQVSYAVPVVWPAQARASGM